MELAGACAELAHRVLRRDFDRIDPTKARIVLVEALPRVLSTFSESLSADAKKMLQRLGVEVQLGVAVKSISESTLTLANGEVIRAANILWGAGVMAHPLTRQLGVELDRGGRIKVQPDLSVPGHPEVFVVGDLASILRENGKPVPGVAPAAMQMARHVARVLKSELNGSATNATSVPLSGQREPGYDWPFGRHCGIWPDQAARFYCVGRVAGGPPFVPDWIPQQTRGAALVDLLVFYVSAGGADYYRFERKNTER